MSPKLPNELVDAIICFVAESRWLSSEDKQTLRSCTLVCRDWLPASRHALFSDVALTGPAAWDSFVRWVVDAEEGRPWLASIHHLKFTDRWYRYRSSGSDVPPEPISGWRGQYVVPILAGHLPNLEFLSLRVDWVRCEPHPTTFVMFSQFRSLREVRFTWCRFPSFGAFRRVLVSLPALKDLICAEVHWPSAPQPSILAVQTSQPAIEILRLSIPCRSCTLAVLEWLSHTPTRSTLLELDLRPGGLGGSQHQISLPHRNIDYYAQVFGPSVRRAILGQAQRIEDITCSYTMLFLSILARYVDHDVSSSQDLLVQLHQAELPPYRSRRDRLAGCRRHAATPSSPPCHSFHRRLL